jgi:hypothetical protein
MTDGDPSLVIGGITEWRPGYAIGVLNLVVAPPPPLHVLTFFSLDEGKRTYITIEPGKSVMTMFFGLSKGRHGFKFGTVYELPDGAFEERQDLCDSFDAP